MIQRTAAGSVLTEDGVRYHRDIANALDIIARATVDLINRGDTRIATEQPEPATSGN